MPSTPKLLVCTALLALCANSATAEAAAPPDLAALHAKIAAMEAQLEAKDTEARLLRADKIEHERRLSEKDARLNEKDAENRRLQEAVVEARRLQQDAGANEVRKVAEIETHTYDCQIDKGGIDLKTKGTAEFTKKSWALAVAKYEDAAGYVDDMLEGESAEAAAEPETKVSPQPQPSWPTTTALVVVAAAFVSSWPRSGLVSE